MESIVKDTKGQWIALSGLVVSVIIIGLAALANQAVLAGYHSSNAALEFPKEDIRELNLHTRDNAEILRDLAIEINTTSNDTIPVIFTGLFNNYSIQIERLHAVHGETVDVSLVSVNSTNGTYSNGVDMIAVNIRYNDGNTNYVAEPEFIEVNA